MPEHQYNVDLVTILHPELLPNVNLQEPFELHVTYGEKISIQNLSNYILNRLTAEQVRDLLQTLFDDDRLDAQFIKNLSDLSIPTTIYYGRSNLSTLYVPNLQVNARYVAVYIERDRVQPLTSEGSLRYSVMNNSITFTPALNDESVTIEFIN